MRKDWKVSLIGLLLLVLILVCACGSKTEAKVEEKSILERVECIKIENNYVVDEFRDQETGVHYFIYSRESGYGGMGGMCPRYNADGTLYVD